MSLVLGGGRNGEEEVELMTLTRRKMIDGIEGGGISGCLCEEEEC